jgi:hypothetical protein
MTEDEIDDKVEEVKELCGELADTDQMTPEEVLTFYEGVEDAARASIAGLKADLNR